MMHSMHSKRLASIIGTSVSIIVLLGIWKFASVWIGSPIILPSPEKVCQEIMKLLSGRLFYEALWATFLRGILGFGLSTAAGIVVGVLSGISRPIRIFLRPLMTVIRATPVLAVILLALVWFSSGFVPVFTAFLMAFPVIAGNLVEGIANTDEKLLEMARSYRFGKGTRILKIYLPSVLPYFIAGASSALGLTWKVIVAGEVLSQPLRAIGTGMQNARIQLETAETFAWAGSAIFLCAFTEVLFASIMKRMPK
jgi:NitT/TauT family transport system permease protein